MLLFAEGLFVQDLHSSSLVFRLGILTLWNEESPSASLLFAPTMVDPGIHGWPWDLSIADSLKVYIFLNATMSSSCAKCFKAI